MENELQEQSEAVEIQTESATVENEPSTQEIDAVESEVVEVEVEVNQTVPIGRLKQETRKWRETERREKTANKTIAELQTKLALQEVVSTKRPALTDEDIDYNQDALDDKMWEWRQNQRDAKNAKTKTVQEQQTINDNAMSSFNKKADDYAKENPSYDMAIDNGKDVEFHTDISAAILQSKAGAQLHHYLLNNTNELEEMSGMNSYEKMNHLGNIERSFSKEKPIKQSNAPAPIETVKGTSSVTAAEYKSGMSDDDYFRMRAGKKALRF